jgi:hypothetical protein
MDAVGQFYNFMSDDRGHESLYQHGIGNAGLLPSESPITNLECCELQQTV